MLALYQFPFKDLRFNEFNDFSTQNWLKYIVYQSKIFTAWIPWPMRDRFCQKHPTRSQILNPNISHPCSSLHLRGQSQECVISFTFIHLKNPSSGGFHFQTSSLGWFFNLSKPWNVSTSSGCRIFNCDHQLENILRNCWLFISNKASPLFGNPDDPSSEKAGYKDPTNYKVVTSSCNSILIRFRMFSTVSRPRHSSRRKES